MPFLELCCLLSTLWIGRERERHQRGSSSRDKRFKVDIYPFGALFNFGRRVSSTTKTFRRLLQHTPRGIEFLHPISPSSPFEKGAEALSAISVYNPPLHPILFAMEFSPYVPSQWLLGIGALFIFSSFTALSFSQRRRSALFERLNLHRRRASGASTPPRSFSPSKRGSISVTCNPDYLNTFPPSRRSALAELAEKNEEVNIGPEPSLDFLMKDPLPTTRCYSLDNSKPKYTPTGFSTAEIKSLGDFPAYDVLSGVPLPEPYEGFDPTKALPRPYRPFRWAYHQTMCKFSHLPNDIL